MLPGPCSVDTPVVLSLSFLGHAQAEIDPAAAPEPTTTEPGANQGSPISSSAVNTSRIVLEEAIQ